MKTIKTLFKNYGNIKDLNIEAENIHILMIAAPNGAGKTTIRTALNEALTGKAIKKQPVTIGEESGFYEILLPDKDGNAVIVRHDFNKFDSQGSFTITDHTGKTYKTRTKLLEILGTYNPIDIQDVFNLTRTPEGTRRFIQEYILPNIPAKVQEQIRFIDDLIAENKGSLIIDRRVAKKEYENAIAKHKIVFTPVDEKDKTILSKKDAALKKLNEIDDKLKGFDESVKKNEELEIKIDKLRNLYGYEEKRLEDNIILLTKQRDGTKDKIAQIEAELRKFIDSLTATEQAIDQQNNELVTAIHIHEKDIKELSDKIVPIPDDYAALNTDFENGTAFLGRINEIEERVKANEEIAADVNERKLTVEAIEKKINDTRKQRKELLADANLPNGLEIDEDSGTIKYNDLDFSSTEISESDAKLTIARLKCNLETAPLLDMGMVSVYGKEKIQQIIDLAKEFNKIIIMEKVIDDGEIHFEAIVEE